MEIKIHKIIDTVNLNLRTKFIVYYAVFQIFP